MFMLANKKLKREDFLFIRRKNIDIGRKDLIMEALVKQEQKN